MNRILVLFDSKSGNVAKMAALVAEGAQRIADTEVRVCSVDEATADAAPPQRQARALPFPPRSDPPLARRQPGARRDPRHPVNASTCLSPRNSMCGRIEMVQPSLEHT